MYLSLIHILSVHNGLHHLQLSLIQLRILTVRLHRILCLFHAQQPSHSHMKQAAHGDQFLDLRYAYICLLYTSKKFYRLYGNDTGKAIADYLCVHDEVLDDSKDLKIFDPEATWKTKTVYNFTAKELQVPIFRNGTLVYEKPSLDQIRDYCLAQVRCV